MSNMDYPVAGEGGWSSAVPASAGGEGRPKGKNRSNQRYAREVVKDMAAWKVKTGRRIEN